MTPPTHQAPATPTLPDRSYEAQAREYLARWKRSRDRWRWTGIVLGTTSTLLASGVAGFGTIGAYHAATQTQTGTSLGSGVSTAMAILVPALTALMGTLKPQAQAAAFETAARELEKELCLFDADPTHASLQLAQAVARGLDTLNRVGSQ